MPLLLQGRDHYILRSYESNGISFDRMLLWEAKQVGGDIIMESVPKRWYHAYQFFNVLVSTDVDAEDHPLNLLKTVHDTASFLAIKIDIDHAEIENKVLNTFIERGNEFSAVDAGQVELMFEQHVAFEPMLRYWKDSGRQSGKTLADSYRIFLEMRRMGIRSHGWI